MSKTYEIITAAGEQGITCMVCGMTSWHPKDVREKYCGKCHQFHELRELMAGVPRAVYEISGAPEPSSQPQVDTNKKPPR